MAKLDFKALAISASISGSDIPVLKLLMANEL